MATRKITVPTESNDSVDTEPNTTQLTNANNRKLEELKQKRMSLAEEYKNEPKVKVKGAPAYQAHFGTSMPIMLNGIGVYVPLDGRSYEIPESFACVFNTRIREIDNMALQQEALSAVGENLEQYPGEKELINPV